MVEGIRPCDVCGEGVFEPMGRVFSRRAPGYRPHIHICRTCGFVTTRPLPDADLYSRVNDQWFSETFATDDPLKASPEKKFVKWSTMWERIKAWYPNGPRSVLDVGAGQGWAIDYLQTMFPDIEAVAIERWEPCRNYIQQHLGAEVITSDIDQPWPDNLTGRFDLIIFRHTLEHMINPIEVLKKINTCLAPGGRIYLVVPNLFSVKPGKPILTDFFRPVHLHYFEKNTLLGMAANVNLVAETISDTGEIWGLFSSDYEKGKEPVTFAYENVRSFLDRRISEARNVDRRAMLRGHLSLVKSRLYRLFKFLRTLVQRDSRNGND